MTDDSTSLRVSPRAEPSIYSWCCSGGVLAFYDWRCCAEGTQVAPRLGLNSDLEKSSEGLH